ncbi:MAG: hypothetical protein ACK4SA_03715, partial [Caldilinea sp.]
TPLRDVDAVDFEARLRAGTRPSDVQRLLDELTARVLIVSFPAQSLGGRRKGMVETYAAQMDALLTGRDWAVERFEFVSELVFRIRRNVV